MDVASIPTESVDPPARVPQTSNAQPARAKPSQDKDFSDRMKDIRAVLYGLNAVTAALFFWFLFMLAFGVTMGGGWGYLGGMLAVGIGYGMIVTCFGTMCVITMKWFWGIFFILISICGFSGGMTVGALLPGYLRVRDDLVSLNSVLDAAANPDAIAVKFNNPFVVDVSVWGEVEGRVRKIDICNVVAPLRDIEAPSGPNQTTPVVAICAKNQPCGDGGVDTCLEWFQDPANLPPFGAARIDSPVIPYDIGSWYGSDYDKAVDTLRSRMTAGTLPESVQVFRFIDWDAEQSRRKMGCIVAAAVSIPLGLVCVALGSYFQHKFFSKRKALEAAGIPTLDGYDSD